MRSISAILAGLVVLTLVSFGIEAAADPFLMHLFPRALPDAAALAASVPARLFMTAYTLLAIAIGGYVTAWIAQQNPLIHVLALALAVLLLSALSALQQRGQHPVWYLLALVALAPTGVLVGGLIRLRVLGIL